MKKKVVSLALTAVMVFTLAACSSGSGDTSSTANSGASSSTTTAADTSAQATTDTAGTTETTTAEVSFDFLNGPVQVILPAKPGGDIDSSGRLFAKDMEPFIGQTLVPVNIDGGGTNLALKSIMDAEADGNQIINFFSFANYVIGGNLEYEWEDLTPIACYAVNDTQILVTRKDSPFSNAQELVDYMKEHPGEVTFSATKGAPSHYHALAFEQAAGVQFKKIDIGSGADKVVSLLSGESDIISSTVGIMKDYIEAGEVDVIGSIAAERSSFGPDIPTLNEQGVNIGDVGFGVHYVVWAKTGTPQEIIDAYASAIEQMTKDPTFAEDCANLQFSPRFMAGQELIDYETNYYNFLNSMSEALKNDDF